MKQTILIWALPANEKTAWKEELLTDKCTGDDEVKRVISLAERYGYHDFRVSVIDMDTPPDFTSTINV